MGRQSPHIQITKIYLEVREQKLLETYDMLNF